MSRYLLPCLGALVFGVIVTGLTQLITISSEDQGFCLQTGFSGGNLYPQRQPQVLTVEKSGLPLSYETTNSACHDARQGVPAAISDDFSVEPSTSSTSWIRWIIDVAIWFCAALAAWLLAVRVLRRRHA